MCARACVCVGMCVCMCVSVSMSVNVCSDQCLLVCCFPTGRRLLERRALDTKSFGPLLLDC